MELSLCSQFPRSEAKFHFQTQIEGHLSLALHCLEAKQDEVNQLVSDVMDQSALIQQQEGQIEKWISHDKEQSQELERLVFKVNEQSRKINQQSQEIEQLKSKDKEQSEKMERVMSTVQNQPTQTEQRGPITSRTETIIRFLTTGLLSLVWYFVLWCCDAVYVFGLYNLFELGYKYLFIIGTLFLKISFYGVAFLICLAFVFNLLKAWSTQIRQASWPHG